MKDFLRKTKKTIFKTFFLARANERYIKMPARKAIYTPFKSNFLLITIAFNDVELIRLQYASLLKNLEDTFDYLIADNSLDLRSAAEIESFCLENHISYIRLPENSGPDGSLHHGLALNWVFYNVVAEYAPSYFGFLDHDIFVISKGSFLSHLLGENYWGLKLDRKKTWYLWAGFSFFSYDFCKTRKMNFLPEGERDTGGANYRFLKHSKISHLIPVAAIITKPFLDGGSSQFFSNIVHFMQGGKIMSEQERHLKDRKEIVRRLLADNNAVV